MQTILTIVQVFLSIALIALVLIQHGRGADAGAAFGSGASATVFGARGSGSFLSRATGILAALFFLTSMALAYYAAKGSKPAGLMDAADGMQVKLKLPATEMPAPVTQAQGSSDVPVVPGVVTKSTTRMYRSFLGLCLSRQSRSPLVRQRKRFRPRSKSRSRPRRQSRSRSR